MKYLGVDPQRMDQIAVRIPWSPRRTVEPVEESTDFRAPTHHGSKLRSWIGTGLLMALLLVSVSSPSNAEAWRARSAPDVPGPWAVGRTTFDVTDPFYKKIHPFRTGVSGHSFGGSTTLALAAGVSGEQGRIGSVEVPGDFEPIRPDPRVRASLPIAPSSDAFTDDELASIRVPTLLLGGDADETLNLDVGRPFDFIRARPLRRVVLKRGGHNSFTNFPDIVRAMEALGFDQSPIDLLVGDALALCCTEDLIPIEEAQRITNLYATSFFRRHLRHERFYDRYLTPAYARAEEPDVDFTRKRRHGHSYGSSWPCWARSPWRGESAGTAPRRCGRIRPRTRDARAGLENVDSRWDSDGARRTHGFFETDSR